ncbi:MAG TPA: hypothetical protein VHO90_15035, partial [Bacteroidales bacterium]|nr:hypothetical protein [Bacteroidales bacterium]
MINKNQINVQGLRKHLILRKTHTTGLFTEVIGKILLMKDGHAVIRTDLNVLTDHILLKEEVITIPVKDPGDRIGIPEVTEEIEVITEIGLTEEIVLIMVAVREETVLRIARDVVGMIETTEAIKAIEATKATGLTEAVVVEDGEKDLPIRTGETAAIQTIVNVVTDHIAVKTRDKEEAADIQETQVVPEDHTKNQVVLEVNRREEAAEDGFNKEAVLIMGMFVQN